eukprot:1295924-Pyramimonas_sp.AAC.1
MAGAPPCSFVPSCTNRAKVDAQLVICGRSTTRKLDTHDAAGLGESWVHMLRDVLPALGPPVAKHAGLAHVSPA